MTAQHARPEPKPAVFARPLPDKHDRQIIEQAQFDEKYRGRPHVPRSEPSLSWWLNGGLIADKAGAGLVDADGLRHEFPFAVDGCFLVRASHYERGGPSNSDWAIRGDWFRNETILLIAAPESYGRQTLLRLPVAGFYSYSGGPPRYGDKQEIVSRLQQLADRAGMDFVDRRYYWDTPSLRSGTNADFPGCSSAMSWEDAIHDQAWRARRLRRRPVSVLRSVLGGRKPEWQKILGGTVEH